MSVDGIGQAEFWNRRAATWDRRTATLGSFSDAYGAPAMNALALRPGGRVLDIGCGPGVTTIELAERVGADGQVVGVDISDAMVVAARQRAAESGHANVSFVVGDAQTEALGHGFDAAFSRFGVMFFADPLAAFANIAGALRPGGRLAFVAWAELADNPWMFVPGMAAGAILGAEPGSIPGPGRPGPFSLADGADTKSLVERAGLSDVATERVEGGLVVDRESADESVRTMLGSGPLGDAFEAADFDRRQAAVDAVLVAFEPYRSGGGWRLPGAALVVTARR